MSPWLYLLGVGILGGVWPMLIKLSNNYQRILPLVGVVMIWAVLIVVFNKVLRTIPMAIAYSTFVGIGAISASMLGYYVFGERINLVQIACIGLILGGIAGLAGQQ